MVPVTTYHFSGPTTTRKHRGGCPKCGKKVTRSRTFEMTISPFNRHPTEDRPKTWDEVRAALKEQADGWVPDFTCQDCDFAADLDRLTVEQLLDRIRRDAYDRTQHRWDRKDSRGDLCNQRIAVYEARIMELEPARVTLPTCHDRARGGGYYCYHEFPDRSRCIFSERHGASYHLSPTGERAPIGGLVVER